MKKTFKCICHAHLLEIEYNEKDQEIWIGIYDIYNPDTGRKYKKPKLTGDVIFYDKELDFLMNFLDDITMAWAVRRNK